MKTKIIVSLIIISLLTLNYKLNRIQYSQLQDEVRGMRAQMTLDIEVSKKQVINPKGYEGICDLDVVVCPSESYQFKLQ